MQSEFDSILLINQPLNNRGDEAAHKALVRSLLESFPKVKIQVLFVKGNQDSVNQFNVGNPRVSYINIKPLHGWQRIISLGWKIKWFAFLGSFHPTVRRIVSIYRKSKIVMCAPGGICMGGFQNWNHVFMLSIARNLNKPIAYYGRSIGPFPIETESNRKFRSVSLQLLQYFSFISLRDKKSMDLADSLNVEYERTADSAFLESPKVEIPQIILNMLGEKPYVVFVPNLLIWHYAFKGKVSLEGVLDFYKKIIDVVVSKYPQHNIVMLPQTFNYGIYEGDDINFFRDLKLHVKKQNLIIVPDIYSSDIQQTIISKASCMIGARYHSVVFAINQAIPFVALSYEHKITGLLESLNKIDSMVDITTAFDSKEREQDIISQFAIVLDSVKKDELMKKRAENMAKTCFEKFSRYYSQV